MGLKNSRFSAPSWGAAGRDPQPLRTRQLTSTEGWSPIRDLKSTSGTQWNEPGPTNGTCWKGHVLSQYPVSEAAPLSSQSWFGAEESE